MEQNAKKKIPCGGFVLGEGLALSKDGKTLNVTSGGSQADWNQNNETQPDYIKNRPGGYDGQQQEKDSGSYKFTYSNGKGTYKGSIARDIIDNSQTVNVTIYNEIENKEFENVPVIQDSNGHYIGDINLIEYPFCFNYPVYMGGGSYENECYTSITPLVSGDSLYISVTGMGAVKPVKFDSKYIDVPSDIGKNNRTSGSGWDNESFAVGINNYTGSGCFSVGTNNSVGSGFAVGTNNSSMRNDTGVFGKNNNIENFAFDSDGAVVVGQYSKDVGGLYEPTFIIGSGNSTTAATVFWADATTGHFLLPVVMTQVQPDTLILKSSTSGSKKKFKITVDDSGAITATATT